MDKTVLIVGPNYFGYNESVEYAFKELGWATEIIDYYDAFPKNIKNFLYYSLSPRLKIDYFYQAYKKKINESILSFVTTKKPDLVLFIKGSYLEESTLKEINKKTKTVLWMMDSVFRFQDTYKLIRNFDYRFLFEETDVAKLTQENIESYFLPMAADSNNYYPIPADQKDIDVLFVGKLYPNRLELFDRLVKRFPNLNIKIYGKYTSLKKPDSFLKYHFSGINKYYTNEFVTPKELNTLYSQSKIALNIHHSQSQAGCNPRVFEILAAKTFQLVDEIPYIKEHFKGQDMLETYETEQELFDKIEYYLNHTGERERIAENGYHHIIENHTFLKRVEFILDVMDSNKK